MNSPQLPSASRKGPSGDTGIAAFSYRTLVSKAIHSCKALSSPLLCPWRLLGGQQNNLPGHTNPRGWSKPCSVWRTGWLCPLPASEELFPIPRGHLPVQQQSADPRQRPRLTPGAAAWLRDELGLCDSKEQDFVASWPLSLLQHKPGLLEKALSPPWRTLATPPAQPSLAAPGKLFTLRF